MTLMESNILDYMTGETKRDQILRVYEKVSLYPLIALGLLFVADYALPIILVVLPRPLNIAIDVSVGVIWTVFVLDYVFRFALSRRRLDFVKSNVIDLVAIVVPAFRPLRALRIVSVLLIATRRFGSGVRNRTTLYVTTIAFFVWFMAGLAITDAERNAPGSSIHNVLDGWWWAFTSLVPGGLDPLYPVTEQGRLIEAGVLIASLAVIGTVGASLAAWFIDRENASERELEFEEANSTVKLDELNRKIDGLLGEIDKLKRQGNL